ncbi:MAG: hypothetical protein P4L90_22410 [Rhodopila sp.]|nr:hypothetical protein [Rhodopila sp.]
MSSPEAIADTADCLFSTILGFMLPFYLAGARGNPKVARDAILELIDAYDAATPAELDLVGRLIGFSAASMDNLRLSMRPDLSDTKVLQYRSNAVALGRLAEQCRKVLDAIQTKREKEERKAASMPRPAPAPVAPPRQPTPPHAKPPAQLKAETHHVSTVEGDPEFVIDIEAMKHNAHAMLADLQARAKEMGAEAPEASIAHAAMASLNGMAGETRANTSRPSG